MVTTMPRTLYPNKYLVPLVQKASWAAGQAGLDRYRKSSPFTIGSLDHSTSSKSLNLFMPFFFAICFGRIPRITESLYFMNCSEGHCKLRCLTDCDMYIM